MRFIYLIAVLLLTFWGCKESTTQPDVNDNYQMWLSNNIHNYSIDQTRVCYCPEGGQKMRITVRSDTIASVVWLSDNSNMPYSYFRNYQSIESLFGIIRTSLTDSLLIEYNREYGYPEKLDINPQQHPFDGGVLYETSNLQIK